MSKPTKARRRARARAHVAENLLSLIEMAMDGRDGGWAHRYTPAEMQDEPELQQTAAADIDDALDDVIRRLAKWIPERLE